MSGSSPLARGTQEVKRLRAERLRFIPACAGNSTWRISSTTGGSVHPRLRGELCITDSSKVPPRGSSPLARGTHLRNPQSNLPYPVHPRLRGELEVNRQVLRTFDGSSPLARGTLIVFLLSLICLRFIPACAGNSLKMVTTLH